MSAYEQKIEIPEKHYQYLLFAAEPYDTIAFKIPNLEIEPEGSDKFQASWDRDKKRFQLLLSFKIHRGGGDKPIVPQVNPKTTNLMNLSGFR